MPDTARDFAEFALMGHDLQSSKPSVQNPVTMLPPSLAIGFTQTSSLMNPVANGILWSGSVDDVR